MCLSKLVGGVLSVTLLVPNLAAAQATKESAYDHRESAEYRALNSCSRERLSRVVEDLAVLETALDKYMADHDRQPPESLGELVPEYLAWLPKDPFAKPNAKVGPTWKPSLGGAGYLYQRRLGSAYVTSRKKPLKLQRLNGSWKIKSVGLGNFPLRWESKNGRGLLRSKGYWSRMQFDVF